MGDKIKKIDKEFVLSDSTVNCYGFRLLTSGYQLAMYAKNPIGYYMHLRDNGVVLKWDDLAIKGDQVTAKPIINLANQRGQLTADEIEIGFLNAASMGNIVILEYSNEPEMMLPGQTGPTITKWYNKECSVVDIPGNDSALITLYDKNYNPLQLASLMSNPIFIKGQVTVPALNAEPTEEPMPPELKEGLDCDITNWAKMAAIKECDYTLYAALFQFKFPHATLDKNRINPDRFKKYTAELKRLRLAELMEKNVDELYHTGEMEELKKLDMNAFYLKKVQYKKKPKDLYYDK